MSLTIELTPAMESQLRREAERLGVAPAEYVRRLLNQQLQSETGSDTEASRLAEDDWLRQLTEWSSSHSDLPPLPAEAFERKSFYEDRS